MAPLTPALEELWRSAMALAEQSGVPAPALVAAYTDLVAEYGPTPPAEAIAALAQRVAAQLGGQVVLTDAALRPIAEQHGLTVDEARRIVQER